ncbi:hypothetical protein Sjap_014787 [Stephania japonica]|uniref:Annexin n=1 Tax=Stephania japonica TaxID=461633 RepID=A0AAP0NS89_9MAGN
MSSVTVPPTLTTPRDDAIKLYKAFKAEVSDQYHLLGLLMHAYQGSWIFASADIVPSFTTFEASTHMDATQRPLIKHEYRAMYSEELVKRLASELKGDTERAVLLWMYDPAERDATVVRQALSGNVIDLRAATELLLAYLTKQRYEGLEVDRMMAEKDAKSLYKAGEKRLGTDEKTFINIFSERSRAHLAVVTTIYRDMYGSLKKAIKSETSANFEFGLLTILRCAQNPAKYFAKVLYKSMKGLGTDDTTLTRVVVTRAEIDMQYIKAEYQKKYRKSLRDAIHSETSGNYKTFLLNLVGH